jgi:hypothetical protein
MDGGHATGLGGELGGCQLADERLSKRLHKLLGQIGGAVEQSIPLACQDWANAKAAYRFLSNGRVNEANILAEANAKTFDEVAGLFIAAHRAGWRKPKEAEDWANSFRDHASPIAKLPVSAIETSHIMSVVEPIWQTKVQTASRLRNRIERVLDYAKARGWRSGENPARWKGHIALMLAKPSKVTKVQHHAALP